MSKIEVALGEIRQSLDQLGFDISHGKYSPAVLRDLKSTVDQLRLALWAIIEFDEQNKSGGKSVPAGLGNKFLEFRIRRLEQMLNDVRGDLTTGVMDGNDRELKTLAGALQNTLRSITHLTHPKA